MKFEWDDNKNKKNQDKHAIDFREAKTIFDDHNSIEFEARKENEYRIIRIGKTATKFILFVVYTMRGFVIRIISARQANKNERNLYLERQLKAQDDENTNG